MTLVPLTDAGEIRSAFQEFAASLQHGAKASPSALGWKGDSATLTVHWHQRHGFWSTSRFSPGDGHYWCPFGTTDPATSRRLGIIVEINPPKRGRDLRCGGVFARDAHGRLWITHTGRVGGGRKGIGKKAFLSYYPGEQATLEWPDGKRANVFKLGMLSHPDSMNSAIGRFVEAVREFKRLAKAGSTAGAKWLPKSLRFVPEFFGRRKAYKVGGWIRGTVKHGDVVTALREVLKQWGFTAYNDQRRDLFFCETGATACLFEVKTDTTTGSVYKGVGQLMLHAATEPSNPTRVLVVPDLPTQSTRCALKELGIVVVTYRRKKGTLVFERLEDVPGLP